MHLLGVLLHHNTTTAPTESQSACLQGNVQHQFHIFTKLYSICDIALGLKTSLGL